MVPLLVANETRRGPGRPAEDRLARQIEVYQAVAPLLLERGVRGLSMREAAAAACLSIGGLYHYFADKQSLAPFGLRPEALLRRCRDWHQQHDYLMAEDPRSYFERFVQFSIDGHAFVRPAVLAALEMGVSTFGPALEDAVTANTTEFIDALRPLAPQLTAQAMETVARQLRRMTFGAVLDRSVTPDEVRAGLRAFLPFAPA